MLQKRELSLLLKESKEFLSQEILFEMPLKLLSNKSALPVIVNLSSHYILFVTRTYMMQINIDSLVKYNYVYDKIEGSFRFYYQANLSKLINFHLPRNHQKTFNKFLHNAPTKSASLTS